MLDTCTWYPVAVSWTVHATKASTLASPFSRAPFSALLGLPRCPLQPRSKNRTCAGDAKIGPNGRTQLAGTEMALDCCYEHCMQGPPHSEHRPMLCCTAKANALNGPPRRYAMHPTLLLRGYLLSTRRDLAKELPWLSTVMLPIPGPKLALRSMRARESSDNSGWGPL